MNELADLTGKQFEFSDEKQKINPKQLLSLLLKCGSMGFPALGTIASMIDETGTETAEPQFTEVHNMFSNIQQLLNIKKVLQDTIDSSLNEDERLIIFVDDLDRLNPSTAVSLLEGIKVFLDCEKCIFVMAIDDEVVYRGINEKYHLGQDDDEKGKMFFDKIIQVPFRIPVEQYEYDSYFSYFVSSSCPDCTGQALREEVEKYTRIIDSFPQRSQHNIYASVHNPRTIKRAFNLEQLHSKILKQKNPQMDFNKDVRRYLFAKHLIEICDEELYHSLISASSITLQQLWKKNPELIAILELQRANDEENEQGGIDYILDEAAQARIDSFLEIMRFNSSNVQIPRNFERIRTFIELVYHSEKISLQNTDENLVQITSVDTGDAICVLSAIEYYGIRLRFNLPKEKWAALLHYCKANHFLEKPTKQTVIANPHTPGFYENKDSLIIIHAESLTAEHQKEIAAYFLAAIA